MTNVVQVALRMRHLRLAQLVLVAPQKFAVPLVEVVGVVAVAVRLVIPEGRQDDGRGPVEEVQARRGLRLQFDGAVVGMLIIHFVVDLLKAPLE